MPIRFDGHRDMLPNLVQSVHVRLLRRRETTGQEWRLDIFAHIGYEQIVRSPSRTARSREKP